MIAGILIAVAGNIATSLRHDFASVAALRLVTGFGSGMCYSAGIACLSLMRNSARHFSVFIVILVLANSAELWLVPSVLGRVGVQGLYLIFGAAFLVPLVLMRSVPGVAFSVTPAVPGTTGGRAATATTLAWWCLAAIVLFNVPASAFWAYSERIGDSIGLSPQAVANTLTLCNLFSLTGSVVAYWLSLRWGQHRPQLVVIGLMAAVFAMWSFGITQAGYVVGVLVFFEIWSMTQVYQLGTLNDIDHQGRYVALVPAAQGLGQSAGPFIGGLLLGWGLAFSQVIAALLVFITGCFAAYLLVYLKLRQTASNPPSESVQKIAH
jgi:predicted MFS family arabinose efflux permease